MPKPKPSEPLVPCPLRLPASLVAKLKIEAEQEGRSMNKQAEYILAKYLRWRASK